MQKILSILLSIFILSACHSGGQKDFMPTNNQMSIYRYDRLQYEATMMNSVAAIQKMNTKSPQATKILIEEVLGLGTVDSPKINERIRDYYKDTILTQLMLDVEDRFKDLSKLEMDFTKSFEYLKKRLPDMTVPQIYALNSALNQSVVVGDSLLGISLDKYMGEDYPLYKKYYYAFQRKSMNPNRILPDCLTFYLFGQYPFTWDSEHRTLFDIIMYRGKIAWVVEKVLKSNGNGAIALGYDDDDLKWCDKNSRKVWNIMNERNHLTTTDPMLIRAYTYPDPNPIFKEKNVPSCIGVWIGLQIVREYMKQHKEVTMHDLLLCTDYHRILKDTRF